VIAPPATPPPDSIRAVVRRVMAAPAYDWQTPHDSWRAVREFLARVADRLDQLIHHHPVIYWAVIAAGVAFLLAILVPLIVRAVAAARAPRALRRPVSGGRVVSVHDATWHLAEMARLRAEGRYADALAHRFVALLLALQAAGALTVQAWKTPAEYVRDASLDVRRREELRGLVGTLYDVLFAGRPCDAPALDDFDRRADQLGASLATQ
jgi:hypothetical protein